MDEAEIAVGGFIIAGGQPSGIFQFVEAAFDHVTQGIDCRIDGQLDQPVPLCRDHGCAAAPLHIFANEVSIIAFVAKQHRGCWSIGIHDRHISLEVAHFSAGQCDGYGQAQRIDVEMDFGRETTV